MPVTQVRIYSATENGNGYMYRKSIIDAGKPEIGLYVTIDYCNINGFLHPIKIYIESNHFAGKIYNIFT